MRYNDDKKLGEINSIMIDSFELRNKLTEITIQKLWEKLMGKTISRYTEKIEFKKGELRIFIQSSSLKNELSLGKEKLQNLINEKLGSDKIKSVRVL